METNIILFQLKHIKIQYNMKLHMATSARRCAYVCIDGISFSCRIVSETHRLSEIKSVPCRLKWHWGPRQPQEGGTLM